MDFFDRMKAIENKAAALELKKQMFDMRRRLNPHHLPEDIKYETDKFKEIIHDIEVQMYVQLQNTKAIYVQNRDAIRKEASGNEDKQQYVDILERLIQDDMEKEFLIDD